MKLLVVATFVAVIACINAQKYTNKYDNVNVDSILGNDRILNNYIKCLLEKGPCTNEGRELKKTLPDALKTNCQSCTDLQKRNSRKVIHHLQDRKPKEWRQLIDKYDPDGNYKKQFEARQG